MHVPHLHRLLTPVELPHRRIQLARLRASSPVLLNLLPVPLGMFDANTLYAPRLGPYQGVTRRLCAGERVDDLPANPAAALVRRTAKARWLPTGHTAVERAGSRPAGSASLHHF